AVCHLRVFCPVLLSALRRLASIWRNEVISAQCADWPNPAALAGRLRRAQPFLRMLGIEAAFSREGRAGTRTMRISSSVENRISAVSTVCHDISARYPKEPQRLGHSSSA